MTQAPRMASTTKAWHIDHSALLPGDVLLEAGNTLFGFGIRAIDGGDYSHALLWLGNTDFLEAVSKGVRVISFARVLISEPRRWLLLRYPDPDVASAAASEARNLAHKHYDLAKAMATKLRVQIAPSPERLFCSQLVAEAYARAGVALVAGVAPVKTKPRDLAENSSLQPLGQPPMIEVSLEHSERALLNRDKAYKNSLPAKERRISQEVFASVAALTLGLVPIPGNLAELMQALADSPDDHSALAGFLLRRLEETGYFTLMDDVMIAVATGTAPTGTPDTIEGWRQSAQRHQQEWRSFLAISQRSPYPLWKRFAQFHLRLYTTFMALIERSG